MNNLSAKEILNAYRSNGSDAGDKNFEKALEMCRHDPELRAWFEEQIHFDRSVTNALRRIAAPEEGKQAILAFAELENKPPEKIGWRRAFPFISIGLAAMLFLGLSLVFTPSTKSKGRFNPDAFSLVQLVGQAMPLDYSSEDREAVRQWLEQNDAPMPPELPDIFELATSRGCRVFSDGAEGQVSLVCFTMDGEFVHVLTFDKRTREYMDRARTFGEWWSEGGLNMVTFEKGKQLFAIATRLPPEKLHRYL